MLLAGKAPKKRTKKVVPSTAGNSAPGSPAVAGSSSERAETPPVKKLKLIHRPAEPSTLAESHTVKPEPVKSVEDVKMEDVQSVGAKMETD